MRPPASTLSLADVEAARVRLAGGIRHTPCNLLPDVPALGGITVWLKREDLQRTHSFKERGALHGLLNLGLRDRRRGIVAASAGNHALGLAFHGARLGVPVTVVMPTGASVVKISRCRNLGATVVLHGDNFDQALHHAAGLALESGRPLINPFDDLAVIAGQGTMALEIAEAVPGFDAIVVPVGGGGLLAGVATVVKALFPRATVIAVQSERAPGLLAAKQLGHPVVVPVGLTLADGIAVACVGMTTFAIAMPLIDEVITVTEVEIETAMSILARNGIVAEGAGATALAAVLGGNIRAQAIVVPVSGGNIDPKLHERVVAHRAKADLQTIIAA